MKSDKRRIWELARSGLGGRKKYVRRVCRKEISPNQRYAWLVYSNAKDTEPVDMVVLDVNLAEALVIDQVFGVEVQQFPGFSPPDQNSASL